MAISPVLGKLTHMLRVLPFGPPRLYSDPTCSLEIKETMRVSLDASVVKTFAYS